MIKLAFIMKQLIRNVSSIQLRHLNYSILIHGACLCSSSAQQSKVIGQHILGMQHFRQQSSNMSTLQHQFAGQGRAGQGRAGQGRAQSMHTRTKPGNSNIQGLPQSGLSSFAEICPGVHTLCDSLLQKSCL